MTWRTVIDTIISALGAIFYFCFGEVTGVFWVLIVFMVVDYITGVIIAIIKKKLSSSVGFKGLAKKLLILVFISLAHLLDTYVLDSAILQNIVVFFYISNEGISIIENAVKLGVPVPDKLREVLEKLRREADE